MATTHDTDGSFSRVGQNDGSAGASWITWTFTQAFR